MRCASAARSAWWTAATGRPDLGGLLAGELAKSLAAAGRRPHTLGMLFAAAAKAATEAHWWDDWPKLAGWAAFAVTIIAAGWRSWVRRRKVALGAADGDLREALVIARTRFEDITTPGGQRADWFTAEERRETDRRIEDLTERRSDPALRAALEGVVGAWRSSFGEAPPWRNRSGYLDHQPTPQEREQQQADQQRFARQIEFAHAGLDHVKTALARLNELERKTLGR